VFVLPSPKDESGFARYLSTPTLENPTIVLLPSIQARRAGISLRLVLVVFIILGFVFWFYVLGL